jgi:microcin C transport system permease protein
MHGMTSYFIRRILLVPITFMCITFMVYTVIRLAPGGPIWQAKQRLMQAATEGGAAGGGGIADSGSFELPEEALEQLERYYKLDKPIPVGYLIWLGLWPDDAKDDRFSGVIQGDFGVSYRYSDDVIDTIVSKFPVSIYFGLIGYFATWLVCVPLGINKALRHRSIFDTATSLVVFVGYSIPGFVAALVLMLLFATPMLGETFELFPLGGFRSDNWDDMWAQGEVWWCVKDQVHHTIIPVIAYVMGGFATMTILMKNSLLDNLGSDYVRTGFAKGLPERRVVFIHALRNSMIPLCVGIGHAIGLIFAGSFLIEKTCNIPGMGLLGFNSLLERDYPVIMGVLVFGVLIRLTGNIFSDIILAVVDPRVRFK